MPKVLRRHEGNGHKADYRRTFAVLGCAFGEPSGSGEALAEACPFCGRDRFSLNVETGLWHCKHEDRGGNVTDFLTETHAAYLGQTTTAHRSALAKLRGVAPQALGRHELAHAGDLACWLVPFKSARGNVVNLLRFYPDREKPNKLLLPELPTALYGFDKLKAADKDKPVLLCEGPFDAIALDYSLGPPNRGKYVVVASPGAFKEEWAEHFRGRKVRAFYDNDQGGRNHTARVQKLLGESGVADELLALKWPDGTPDGYDVNDLVRERPGRSVLGWLVARCFKVIPEPRLAWVHGTELDGRGEERIDWVWPNRLRCGTYASLSGKQATLKSTLVRELVARFTSGDPLPGCDQAGMPAGHVVYVTAEDSTATVGGGLKLAGADMHRVLILPATLKDGDPLNILEHLEELRQKVREYGVRLVVIDGQNSVVGGPCIATDMLARHNVTNKLHQFAQREDVCLLGVRNEDAEGRALGPQSMGDLARCVLRVVELSSYRGERFFELHFVKVSDAARSTHPPCPTRWKTSAGLPAAFSGGKPGPPGRPGRRSRTRGPTPRPPGR
ncbi:MAG TPA: AAA family ATPase [Gemmataceae bacterium]|nr:AAA family ATPase [Gemmataceae bacterium]